MADSPKILPFLIFAVVVGLAAAVIVTQAVNTLDSSGLNIDQGTVTITDALQTGGGASLANTPGTLKGLTVQYGNVGIGTLNPDAKLDVAGTIEVGTGSRGVNLRSSEADNFRLHTWTNTPNPNFAISAGDGLGGESSTVWIEGESSTLRLMKNGGNVNIGNVDLRTYIAQLAGPITLTLNRGCKFGLSGCAGQGGPPHEEDGPGVGSYGAFFFADTNGQCCRGTWHYFTNNGSDMGSQYIGVIRLPANHGITTIGVNYQLFGASDDTKQAQIVFENPSTWTHRGTVRTPPNFSWAQYTDYTPAGFIQSGAQTIYVRFYGNISGGNNDSGADGMGARIRGGLWTGDCDGSTQAVCYWHTDTPANNNTALFAAGAT